MALNRELIPVIYLLCWGTFQNSRCIKVHDKWWQQEQTYISMKFDKVILKLESYWSDFLIFSFQFHSTFRHTDILDETKTGENLMNKSFNSSRNVFCDHSLQIELCRICEAKYERNLITIRNEQTTEEETHSFIWFIFWIFRLLLLEFNNPDTSVGLSWERSHSHLENIKSTFSI